LQTNDYFASKKEIMALEDFFERIQQHLSINLPFVVYRKPNEEKVNAILQNNDAIHTIKDFSESGFVFAPFDNSEETILIPFSQSNFITGLVVISNYIGKSDNSEEILKQHFDKLSVTVKSDKEKRYHINLVEKAIETIDTEELLKVVLSRKEAVDISETNPLETFKQLLNAYKSAFVYCWFHPKVGLWLGATPETLLKTEGSRFSTMALAGTQPYTESQQIVWGNKEVDEQKLVTDFVVDSLQSKVSTLNVSDVETVRAGNLLHLKTKITGVLNNGIQEVLKVLHPTPAVCGLPKVLAKDFIIKNENYNREFYTGFLGELNLTQKTSRNSNRRNVENNAYASIKKTSNLFVNLRCMQLKNNRAMIYVGGGITKDSIPESEWQETVIKTYVMKKVLQ